MYDFTCVWRHTEVILNMSAPILTQMAEANYSLYSWTFSSSYQDDAEEEEVDDDDDDDDDDRDKVSIHLTQIVWSWPVNILSLYIMIYYYYHLNSIQIVKYTHIYVGRYTLLLCCLIVGYIN